MPLLPGRFRPAHLLAPALLPLALAQAPAPPPTGLGDPLFPKLGTPGVDVQHYDLDLKVDPLKNQVDARVTIDLTATAPLNTVRLDFLGPPVSGVQVDGRAAAYTRADGKLNVALPQALRAGDPARIVVEYAGQPQPIVTDDLDLPIGWRGTPGGTYVLSEPDATRTWLPCSDHPSDKATFTTHLSVPDGYTGAASGVLSDTAEAAGRTTFTWQMRRPIPTYAMTVHVNRFEPYPAAPGPDGVQLRDELLPGTPEVSRAAFARAGEMIRVLSGWFGPYPFEAYGVAITEDRFDTALESATLSTFSSRPYGENAAVHELAHQWFGDDLTPRSWPDVWLNEGFAKYSELLWAQAQQGPGVTAGMVQRWYDLAARHAGEPLQPSSVATLFGPSVYQRGALVLHALRVAVGDAAFRRTLQAYRRAYGGGNASTADLLAVVRRETGQTGLDAMRPWMQGTTLPPLPDAFLR